MNHPNLSLIKFTKSVSNSKYSFVTSYQIILFDCENCIKLGLGGGDPHFMTLDSQQYSFNGYGEFLLLKANDKSFEIQVKTSILNNSNDQFALIGSVFSSFALRTNQTPVFQIDIADANSNPYIGMEFVTLIYCVLLILLNLFFSIFEAVSVNGKTNTNFSRGSVYSTSYPCIDNQILTCSILSLDSQGFKIVFSNGLSATISIEYAPINQFESVSWFSISIALSNQNYIGNVYGLMGNYNGISNDDLVSRIDGKVPANMTERGIYDTAITCTIHYTHFF